MLTLAGESRLSRSVLLCVAVALTSCGDDASSSSSGGGTAGGGGSGGSSGTDACSGTFALLQKDAYRDTAGRSSELWPPHTTTTLTFTCTGDDEPHGSFMANHGTEPGATDANGDVFLVEVGTRAIEGTRAELEALEAAYQACECGTQFLSLDALQDQAVQELVQVVADYVIAHLTCSGGVTAEEVVSMLEQGDIDGVLAALPSCTWDAGADWASGFDEALAAVIDAAGEVLADYHVCNNDAALQLQLVEGFVATGAVTACDGSQAACHGPTWFFSP